MDDKDNVWLTGTGPGDGQILKFTRTGKFILQFGGLGQARNRRQSNSTEYLNSATGVAQYVPTSEIFISDGYGNRRVVVLDATTGKYKRHWGAYGKPPDDTTTWRYDANEPNPQFNQPHGIAVSKDGFVYVADRNNSRIQAFKVDGTYIAEKFVENHTMSGTAFGIALSADPEEKHLYMPDGRNEKVWILERKTLEILGSFGCPGHAGGCMTTPHSIAVDSKNNIYIGETWEGKRIQRFLYKGMRPQPTPQSRPAGRGVPQFQYDKTWPKPLPNQMKVGQVVGISLDSRNHVWIVQRPKTLKGSETEAADGRYVDFVGAISGCCRPALPVLEFDQQGEMVQMWGGPQDGIDWPTPGPKSPDTFYGTAPFGERGIFIDRNDNVWLGADGPGDGQVLKMSRFGRPLLQIGKKGQSKGSNDTASLNGAAGIVVDQKTNEVFVADGLRNRRVAVFDGRTGKYLRHWGAYGRKPDDSVPQNPDLPDVNSPQFGDVHCIAMSRDSLVYVCDRANNRVQVFRTDGTFVKQGTIAPTTPGGTAYGIAFSADPGQRYAYVVDGTNEKVWILDRSSMDTIGSFGSGGHFGGQFTAAHSIATDAHGNIYVGESWEGKRVQRFLYKGITATR